MKKTTKTLKKNKTNIKSKRPYGDMATPLFVPSAPKRRRHAVVRGCLLAVLAIAIAVAMAFWWKREVAHAEEYVTPHMSHNQVIL